MKKWLAMLLCSIMVLSAIPAFAGTYTPGTYTAASFGMNGDVVVTMTFDAEAITAVEAVGDKETPGIGTKALENLPEQIIAAQSADLDAIATVTVTSDALLKAAQDCILQAKGEKSADASADAAVGTEADVIIVGAGASGLAAAYEAALQGASVIVLEAGARAGGSAFLSDGNLNCINTETLTKLGRNDNDVKVYLDYTAEDFPAEYAEDLAVLQADVEKYLADTANPAAYDSVARIMIDHYLKGKGTDLDGVEATLDYAYIRKAIDANEDIYQWLVSEGVTFDDPIYKHFVTPSKYGVGLIGSMLQAAEDEGAKVVYNTRGVELITDESGKICGVNALANGETVTYTANKAVILATGSYSANLDMVVKYQNVGKGISTNTVSDIPPTCIGDGIVMAEKVGAKLTDMQFVGFIWMGYKGLASNVEAWDLGATKQLAVNEEGKRFTNDESANLYLPTMQETDAIVNLAGDKAMYDAIEAVKEGLVADLEARGVLFMGDTLEEAAQKAGVDAAAYAETVKTFNSYVDNGKDPDFGRESFNGKVETAPYVIVKCQSANHLTFGGLSTDLDARVLREDGTAIEGLYAAGDVVAGFEGAAHQTGDCLTICMYYGKVAGMNAAQN